jgi:hypothetical protein
MSLATLDKPKVAARRVEFASLLLCGVDLLAVDGLGIEVLAQDYQGVRM